MPQKRRRFVARLGLRSAPAVASQVAASSAHLLPSVLSYSTRHPANLFRLGLTAIGSLPMHLSMRNSRLGCSSG